MNRRLSLVAASLLILPLCGWHFANEFIVATAVSRPGLTLRQRFGLMGVSRKYQVAAPHRTIFQELRFSIIPVVQACATANCDSTGLHWVPLQGCPPTQPYCGPNKACWHVQGCAQLYCESIPGQKVTHLCVPGWNPDRAHCGLTCELDDINSKCTPPCGRGGPPCPP
jgi:hypothetical protein